MTESPEAKIAKLLNDPFWRLNNLYWIQGLNEEGKVQKMKFRMNAVQQLYYWNQWWRDVILKSRQHGISTLKVLQQLDRCIFNKDQQCGIIDKTDVDAKKKLKKALYAYDHLDDPEDPKTSHLGAGIKEKIRIVTSNEHELSFTNNSGIVSGTSLRGDTLSDLWISELGYIAYFNKQKAEEIKSGSLNTIHRSARLTIESTHEGGKLGLNYEMIKIAMEAPEEMTPLDMKFHFFGWFEDPKNTLALPASGNLSPTKDQKEYFTALLDDDDICLTEEQKHWYIKTELIQKGAMKKEHPSTAEEAFSAVIRGAIYGKEMSKLRKNKRIINFEVDRRYPLWVFYDCGQTDHFSMGLLQFTGKDIGVLDTFTWKGEDYMFYVAKSNEWEDKYGFIHSHYLPHDGAAHQGAKRDSWEEAFLDAGLKRVNIVPRTPDVWIGIKHLRTLLPRFWIHKDNCSVEREIGTAFNDMEVIPSAITCLESYRTKPQETGARIQEMPVHDESSHTCDMFRTFAEAHARGMLEGPSGVARESRKGIGGPQVITGPGPLASRKVNRGPRVLS